MKQNIDVSISICSYNTAEITLKCIRSIIEQTTECSYEIIVVDNASHDGSADRIAIEFPDVRLIRNIANNGVAAATNQAIDAFTGRYFLTMNSDVIITDYAIDKLVHFMDTMPDVGGCTPKLLNPDGSLHVPPFADPPTPVSEIRDVISTFAGKRGRSSRPRQDEVDLLASQEVKCVVWGTCFIVRRETIDLVGSQDPRYFVYCEDTDWSMVIRKGGWKLWYYPEAEVIHIGGQSSDKGENPKMVFIRNRSNVKLIRKHYGIIPALAYRSALLLTGICGYLKWRLLPTGLCAEWKKKAAGRRGRFTAMMRAALSVS